MTALPEPLAGITNPWTCPGGTAVLSSSRPEGEWLAARDGLIGASEVAQLLGLLPQYGDGHSIWLRKTGRMPAEPTTDAQRRGQVFEDAIVALWTERFAAFPVVVRKQGLMRARRWPHMGATVDRLSICAHPATGPSRCIVEVKSAARFEDWLGDEVPTAYQLQGQVQLGATGRDHVHYVVMGPRFQIEHRLVHRDEELIATLGEHVETWWAAHMDTDEAPEPTAASLDAIRRSHYHAEPKKAFVITPELEQHARALTEALAEIDEQERVADNARALLMAAMDDATELVWDDGTVLATWRPSRTIDGANAAWRKANADLVQRYSVPVPEHTELDLNKLVENEPQLIERGELRYRRTFKPVRSK